ncbi:hypothetical protein [Litoribaculum gwangyangense]
MGKRKTEEKIVEDKLAKQLVREITNRNNINFEHVTVILSFLAKKDDSFQLFYSEDYMLSFNEKDMITTGFKGSNNYQSIVFKLPKNVFPDRYRLDVGSNIEQKWIKIESLQFRYGNNEIFIPQQLISKLLVPNTFIEYNEFENVYNLLTLNVEKNDIYDPYFTCSPELVRLLLEL